MERIKHTIEPIYNKNSRVLILGSFPSVKSRAANFFYQHPQNRFWKVLAMLTREEVPVEVEDKKKLLLTHGIAVWDVIESCEINGSSDSSISDVIPANLSRILDQADIKRIYINGGKAFDLYEKYHKEATGIEAVKLPSTSPANASFSLEKLLDSWKVMIPYLKLDVPQLDPGIVKALLSWYDYNARILPWRETPTPYRVWISEVMLQQTRVEAVKPYYDRFMSELPTVADLAGANEEQLMKLWEGLGYYNRARNLQKAAITVMEEYGGELPDDYEQLLELSGIGEYTAGAIGSIAYGIPVPAVDGNVLRVITRLTGNYEDILKPATKKQVTQRIQEVLPIERAGDFNQALMELGATVCVPNGKPRCEVCPWDTRCEAYKQDLTARIPVKASKKARRKENKTIFLLEYEKHIALNKRSDKGLLAGLWEYPNVDGNLTLNEVEEQLMDWHIEADTIEPLTGGKHIFSHIEWHMAGYHIKIKEHQCKENWVWADRDQIKDTFTIPTAFEVFRNQQ